MRRLLNYWKRYPPLRDLVARFTGFNPDAGGDEDAKKNEAMNAQEFMRMIDRTGGKIAGLR